MVDKNIQARNKFVNKITTKINKLNKDINLLIKVDNALKIQAGGGLMDNLNTILTTPGTAQTAPNYTAVVTESNRIADDLENNIIILENTLKSLITSLAIQRASTTPVTVSINDAGLNIINDKISTLKTNLDIDLVTSYNNIFEEYKGSNKSEDEYKMSMTASSLSDQLKQLLHTAINIERRKNVSLIQYSNYK
jgi:hypothetical protein